MTDLQKLSLKKLRKMRLPLFVLDKKSNKKQKGFVVLDLEGFSQLQKEKNPAVTFLKKKPIQKKNIPDFRSLGLLWDRPQLTNRQFFKCVKEPLHPEHKWALKRFLEYAPSVFVTHLLSLEEIREAISEITLRPPYQEAWLNAVQYWSKNSSYYFSGIKNPH